MTKKHGFSLVELMVTLIVVSMLVAAMAPVITKKLKNNTVAISGVTTSNGSAMSCDISCTNKQAKDSSNCECKECSVLFGDSCLRCDITKCTECSSENYLNNGVCIACENGYYCDGTSKIDCPVGYYCQNSTKTQCPSGSYNDETKKVNSSDCKSCSSKTSNCANCDYITGECTDCEDKYELSDGTCKLKNVCGELAMKITYNDTDYCITKYNVGDMGLEMPSSVTFVAAGKNAVGGESCSGNCCWGANESSTSDTCDTGYTYYNPCTRTACNFAGASAACNGLVYDGHDDWVLPPAELLLSLDVNTYSIGKGSDGLMLCDSSGDYVSPQCSAGTCINSLGCNPYYIWTKEASDGGSIAVSLSGGQLAKNFRSVGWALSVRCIRKL